MPDNIPLTPGDKDFLAQLCGFAEEKAQNGVYMGYFVSQSRNNQRYVVVVAIGDQADAVQKILLDAQAPQSGIEVVSDLSSVNRQW